MTRRDLSTGDRVGFPTRRIKTKSWNLFYCFTNQSTFFFYIHCLIGWIDYPIRAASNYYLSQSRISCNQSAGSHLGWTWDCRPPSEWFLCTSRAKNSIGWRSILVRALLFSRPPALWSSSGPRVIDVVNVNVYLLHCDVMALHCHFYCK